MGKVEAKKAARIAVLAAPVGGDIDMGEEAHLLRLVEVKSSAVSSDGSVHTAEHVRHANTPVRAGEVGRGFG